MEDAAGLMRADTIEYYGQPAAKLASAFPFSPEALQ
jgi:hypothetical protein